MKKSDLINGTIVVFRHGGESLVVDNNLISRDFNFSRTLDDFNEDLTNKVNSLHDIVKIIKIGTPNHILWERKEIDWSKVPIGTKILFSINGGEYTEGLFIKKDGNKFIVCDDIKNRLFTSCNYCKLAEESKEEVTYKELENKYNDFEDVECEECGCCKYKEYNACVFAWILDNYNVTRK